MENKRWLRSTSTAMLRSWVKNAKASPDIRMYERELGRRKRRRR